MSGETKKRTLKQIEASKKNYKTMMEKKYKQRYLFDEIIIDGSDTGKEKSNDKELQKDKDKT